MIGKSQAIDDDGDEPLHRVIFQLETRQTPRVYLDELNDSCSRNKPTPLTGTLNSG